MNKRVGILIVELLLATGLCLSQPVWQGGIIHSISGKPVPGYDGGDATYGRIIRASKTNAEGISQDILVSAYLDAQGPEVWTHDGLSKQARDVFVSRSLDEGTTWSAPLNISRSAGRSSIAVDGDFSAAVSVQSYAGDSFRMRIESNGSQVLVAWLDRYCLGGEQGLVQYNEPYQLEVPFACIWAARSVDGGESWSAPQQLSLGRADANQINGSQSEGGFALVWQEDPRGLQPGEAEGPGDGGSGARTSPGTDIWYTALSKSSFGKNTLFPEAIPISNNSLQVTLSEEEGHEGGGSPAASRPQVLLLGTTAAVAYEETKGISVTESGKYIRYHVFSAFDDSLPDATAGTGWILSTPSENARRVRLVRPSGGSSGDLRIFIFWRQGVRAVSSPADIVGRLGRASSASGLEGLLPEDFQPPLHSGVTTHENAALSSPPLNLSSSAGLNAGTGVDPGENARAHRAIVKGNFVALGYLRTGDQTAAEARGDTYNFFVRRSFDGGLSWDAPVDLSRITDFSVEAFEPRLIATPGAKAPAVRNDLVLFVAWAFRNKADGSSAGIFYRRSTDQGQTYENLQPFRATGNSGSEVQMRTTPDGCVLFAAWREINQANQSNILFRRFESAFPLLDIDGNGSTDALTDGILMLRYLFGMRGSSLIQNAVGGNALRLDAGTILHYLNAIAPLLDVEGNGNLDALSDGILLLRYLFGFRGESLVQDALQGGGARAGIADIEQFLSGVL